MIKIIDGLDKKGNWILVDFYYIIIIYEDNILVIDIVVLNIKVFNMEGRLIVEYGIYGVKE